MSSVITLQHLVKSGVNYCKVRIISGGNGAMGANGLEGIFTDKKITNGFTDSKIRVLINKEIVWGLNDKTYEVKFL